jgi:GAF domain-containing protein
MADTYPVPENENERLEALQTYQILDTEAEEEFDAICHMVAQICKVPIGLISLVDKDRQWFKSKLGLVSPELPRETAFCTYAIMQTDVYEVEDTMKSELFRSNPLVISDPNVRFYAGMPLTDSQGYNLGTLCILDTVPRKLTQEQRQVLREFAKSTVRLIESYKKARIHAEK